MLIQTDEIKNQKIDLRRQAHFQKAQHRRAAQRGRTLKEEISQLKKSLQAKVTYRYCGRFFSTAEIDYIRALIVSDKHYNRAELSRVVCKKLDWLRPDGQLKDMSCRVAMLRMQNDGLIRLPSPKRTNGNGRISPKLTSASESTNSITTSVHTLGQIELHRVDATKQSRLWNELRLHVGSI